MSSGFADKSLPTFLLLLIAAVVGGWILWLGSSLLIPLVLAIFVWYLVDAMARGVWALLPEAIATRTSSAGGSPPVAMHFALLALLFTVFFLATKSLVDAADLLQERIPAYADNVESLLLNTVRSSGLESYLPDLEQIMGSVNFAEITKLLLGAITSTVGSSAAVLLYVVFLVLEQHSFSGKLLAVCGSKERGNMVAGMLNHIGKSIRTYVWLKSVLALLTGFSSYVVLLLVGVDFAVFWGVAIFALTYVPYVGALLSVLLPALLALAQFGQWDQALHALAGLTVVQVVLGTLLEPKLFSRSFNISPLAVLFSLTFWGALWGGTGMFLSVPITVVVMIVCAHMQQLRPVARILSLDGSIPESGQGSGDEAIVAAKQG